MVQNLDWILLDFTGQDCVKTFKGKGKVTPLKRLMKYCKFHSAFSKLGEE